MTIMLVVVAILTVFVSAALIAVALNRSDNEVGRQVEATDTDDHEQRSTGDDGGTEDQGDSDQADSDQADSDQTDSTQTSTTTTTSPAPTTTNPLTTKPIGVISAAGITASGSRPAVSLRCTGEPVGYGPENLVDGDMNTGWGASKDDGTGAWAEVDLGSPTRLARISITAGYSRVGPRHDQGCAAVSAFGFNRVMTAVRYDFDDGTSAVQNLSPLVELQAMPVDVVTTRVRITILGTTRPPGADSDTIISEAVFEGAQ